MMKNADLMISDPKKDPDHPNKLIPSATTLVPNHCLNVKLISTYSTLFWNDPWNTTEIRTQHTM
jgi:hypothetical protein